MIFLPVLDVYSFVQSDIRVQFQAAQGEGYPANAEAEWRLLGHTLGSDASDVILVLSLFE